MSHYNGKIKSLQALRALAFLGIFLCHAGASIVHWSALGVSIFFVLSGFLMYYQYDKKDIPCSLKENAGFSWKKIKKIYPLHIITMCFAVILYLVTKLYAGFTLFDGVALAGAIGLNVTLLQTWVPHSSVNVSLNGVAWYLSVTMFLYFVFPYLKRWIQKIKNRTLLWLSVLLLVLEIMICVPWILIFGTDSPVYIWFMYCFPVFRLGDFFLGCCLGKYYVENAGKRDLSFLKASGCEIIATILTVFVFLWVKQGHTSPILLATHNWTTLYTLLAIIWIFLFVQKKGILTRLLTNRVTVLIGDISSYTFLIHFVVTQYINTAVSFFLPNLSVWENGLKIAIEFGVTILVTFLYMKWTKKKIWWTSYRQRRNIHG